MHFASPLVPFRDARQRSECIRDHAVALPAREGICRTPFQPDGDIPAVYVGRVDDDEVPESPLRSRRSFRSGGEDPLVVPLSVEMLVEPHDRPRDIHVAEEYPAIEDVPHIVSDAHRAGSQEQRVPFIPNLERIDRHAGEQSPRYTTDVESAANLSIDPRLNVLAHLILPEVRLGHGKDSAGDDDKDRHQRDCAPCDDELPA